MHLRISNYFEIYASYVGQAFWVFISFFVLTVFPILFGVEAYGKFAATTAITFIAQRIIDLVAESHISEGSYRDTIKSSIFLGFLACSLGLFVDLLTNSHIFRLDYILLISLISSNAVLNISFQILSAKIRAIYLATFSLVTVLLSCAFWLFGNRDISALLTSINLIGALLGSIFIVANQPSNTWKSEKSKPQPDRNIYKFSEDIFQRILFASFSIFVTYGTVLMASNFLSFKQIGILRIFLTIVSIGNFISPVNPKEFYKLSAKMSSQTALLGFFLERKSIYVIFILAWLATYGCLVIFAAESISIFIVALSLYAAILFSSVIEKVALFKLKLVRMSVFVASYTILAVVVLLIPSSLNSFILALATVIILYPIYLTSLLQGGFLKIALSPVALSATCIVLTYLARPELLN